tara:strand:+ start:2203 stop:2481 length:279 start_codon:yes stop_codon:yes gene_type:complete
MYRFILIIIIIIPLSSCATGGWEHPTKNQSGSYLDLLHCKQEISLYMNSQDQKLNKNEIEKCMQKKYGWIKNEESILRYYLPFPFNLLSAYQ